MSHFAKINSSNIVTEVIVAERDFINSGKVGDEFLWIQTSYNNNFRKKFAKVGDTYDKVKDKFIVPQPFSSWTLNVNDDWEAPVSFNSDYEFCKWDEETTTWVEITVGE